MNGREERRVSTTSFLLSQPLSFLKRKDTSFKLFQIQKMSVLFYFWGVRAEMRDAIISIQDWPFLFATNPSKQTSSLMFLARANLSAQEKTGVIMRRQGELQA